MDDPSDAAVRQRAIEFHNGRARLVGGPGCGKSSLLRDRTRALVESGVSSDEIVFLTFTRRAVASLQADLLSLESPPRVYTLHSYCLTQLRKAAGDLYVGLEVLDDLSEESLFKPLAMRALRMTRRQLANGMFAFQNSWYDPGLPIPQGRVQFDQFLQRVKAAFNAALRAELVVRYREYLHEGGTRPRITHLVVDEFQDLNQAECEVIDILTEPAASLLVAGDDDQAIYEFKGARPDFFRRFVEAHAPCEDFVLRTCHRYLAAIGERLDQLISHDRGDRIAKPMIYSDEPSDPPEVFAVRSEKEQRHRLIEVVSRWRDAAEAARAHEGAEFRARRALVLLCWKGGGHEMVEALRTADLIAATGPVELEPTLVSSALALRALCRVLLTDRATLVHGLDLWAWAQTWPQVGPGTILDLMDFAAARRATGRVALSDLAEHPSPRLRAAGRALEEMRAVGAADVGALGELLQAADLPEQYRRDMIRLLGILAEGLPVDTPLVELLDRLGAVVLRLTDDPPRSGEEATPALNVEVMTLHASKGLTSDYVVLVDAFREVLPGARPMDQARRLAYVALSRARSQLVVLFPRYVYSSRRKHAGLGAALAVSARRPSPYLVEAGLIAG